MSSTSENQKILYDADIHTPENSARKKELETIAQDIFAVLGEKKINRIEAKFIMRQVEVFINGSLVVLS